MDAAEAANGALAEELVVAFPIEAARALERCAAEDVADLLAGVAPAAAGAVLRAMAAPVARAVFAAIDAERAAAIAEALPAPSAAWLLRRAPAERAGGVLAAVEPSHRAAIERALEHRPDAVAALMDPDVLSLAPDVDAAHALEQIRARRGAESDRVYVVDRDGHLAGVAGVAAIVAAEPGVRLAEIVETDIATISAADDARAIASHPGWARWRSVPVVDAAGLFVGVVRYDAVERLLLEKRPRERSAATVPVSLAELFWLGLTGFTDGLARTVASRVEEDER